MIENMILANLVYNEVYTRRVLPFLKPDYFHNPVERQVFEIIDEYVHKYNGLPSREALLVELNNKVNVPDQVHKEANSLIGNLGCEQTDQTWLLDTTEKFCKDKAFYNAMMRVIKEADAGNPGVGPQIMAEALAVCFDNSIGHDYLNDYMNRYDFYHQKEERIPFGLELMNKITKGGLPRKTLNILLAGTGVGKTLFMCDYAAEVLMRGKNVLYITMEMAEQRIAERIDAKLMNVTVDELALLDRKAYENKVQRIRNKTVGKLVIKEYPTGAASAAHFRHLLNELKLKKNFVPDIVFIDYLNICSSSRVKGLGTNVNSYSLVKSIAEELRGLAVEFNVPIFSATQTNRAGYSDTDVGLENTSESFGLPMTADFMFALMTSEDLQKLGQMLVKQLKNRYSDPSYYAKFVIGVNRSKMTLFDVEQDAQDDLIGTGDTDESVFDNSAFGQADEAEQKKSKFRKLFE